MEKSVLTSGELCNYEVTFPLDSRPGDRMQLNFYELDNADATVAVG